MCLFLVIIWVTSFHEGFRLWWREKGRISWLLVGGCLFVYLKFVVCYLWFVFYLLCFLFVVFAICCVCYLLFEYLNDNIISIFFNHFLNLFLVIIWVISCHEGFRLWWKEKDIMIVRGESACLSICLGFVVCYCFAVCGLLCVVCYLLFAICCSAFVVLFAIWITFLRIFSCHFWVVFWLFSLKIEMSMRHSSKNILKNVSKFVSQRMIIKKSDPKWIKKMPPRGH